MKIAKHCTVEFVTEIANPEAANRGLSAEELIEGVEMASMVDLVDWVVTSDRTVSF